MYYKFVQTCKTKWVRFVLSEIVVNVVTDCFSSVIISSGKSFYKIGQLLEIRATVNRHSSSNYKDGQNLFKIRGNNRYWGLASFFLKKVD